jgi:hypothetical protein
MPPHRASLVAAAAAGALLATATPSILSCARPSVSTSPATIMGRRVRSDEQHRLLAWPREDAPYAHVARLAWQALEHKFPVQENGVETWLAYSRFDPETFEGINWPHNPAGLYAMLTDSAVLWYAFSGDAAAVDLARKGLDYSLAHGTTPADWDWARVPYASANAGDVEYRGADDEWCDFCGRGDGVGVIEPDKVGELGFAYVQAFELTGDERYRDAAVACADALATHVREGDARRSPWPFRVYAQSNVVREEYSANVIGAITLFDELRRLSLGDVDAYGRARGLALDWLMRVPIKNDAWSGYFEDIDIHDDPSKNPNQYIALRTARWLLAHRESDPEWRDHVAHLLAWTVHVFGQDTATERGTQWGATVLSEQAADMAKMGSHTARFGATAALWSEATGDASARARAERSLDWATYACSDDGVVVVGEDTNEGWWFSDGYGDYIRHFLVAMGAVPEWAPLRENHLLRSTSIVKDVRYEAGLVAWTTFDADATETLRVTSPPTSVTVDGAPIARRPDLDDEGYTVAASSSGVVVRVRHRRGSSVRLVLAVESAGAAPDPTGSPDAPTKARVDGCSAAGPGRTDGKGEAGVAGLLVGALAIARLARRGR